MNINILKKVGLSTNEIKVYEALLTLGRSKTGSVIHRSEVGSSQTYQALTSLVKRGLVSYQVRNNVRYYQAELPDVLIEDTRQSVLALEGLSQEIKDSAIRKESRNFINTFEGKDGFRKAFSMQYEDLVEEGETLYITGFKKSVPSLRELRNFLKKPNQVAEEKGCVIKMVLDEHFRNNLEEREGDAYEVRFLPSQYFTPMGISVCKKEVLMSVWGGQPMAISIAEPSVVKSFMKNFEVLWELAEI